MTIETLLNAFTTLGARWVLWALAALSFLCIGIIVERSVFFWLSREDLTRLSEDMARLAKAGRWEPLRKLLSESPSYEARVAMAGLDSKEPRGADELMQGALESVRLELERYLVFLGTIGSNAPFVGLLGTVIGIIGAFRELDIAEGSLSGGLMREIGEALAATAVGLLVALPAVAAFNIFRRIVQSRISRAEMLRHQVLGLLHTHAEHD